MLWRSCWRGSGASSSGGAACRNGGARHGAPPLLAASVFQWTGHDSLAAAGIHKHAGVHTLRHSFATQLLLSGTDSRQAQDCLGHENVETTMVYTHVARELRPPAASPLDRLAFAPSTRGS